MSLSQLVGGADCGPVNPLQGLTKTWDRDRSLLQDQTSSVPGSSRQAFHNSVRNAQLEEEAARFFSPGPSTAGPSFLADRRSSPQVSFDLSNLSRALPTSAGPGWASDFLARPQQQQQQQQQQFRTQSPQQPQYSRTQDWASGFQSHSSAGGSGMQVPERPWAVQQPGLQPFQDAYQAQRMPMFEGYRPQLNQLPVPPPHPAMDFPPAASFVPQDAVQLHEATASDSRDSVIEAEDLAATASLLLDSVKFETDPKFQNSAFMSLMHQFKDKTATVDGHDIVVSQTASVDEKKGKARAAEDLVASFNASQAEIETQGSHGVPRPDAGVSIPPYSDELALAQDLHEYPTDGETVARRKSVHFEPESSFTAQTREWEQLLEDWETFEGAEEAIRPVEETAYKFDERNPYMEQTRHHSMHSFMNQSFLSPADQTVLEKEAAVQQDPTNATAWYELGVKQQENEREQKAIQALRKAVELDPDYLNAWLALAVSLVNENDRRAAYDAIEHWIDRNARYHGIQMPTSTVPSNTQAMTQRLQLLLDQLLTMARSTPEGQIDADVQVALGVLFNTTEDYAKAIDCFQAALHVRQEDWQLYNRIGASLANSGHAEEAMAYYQRALELNPAYIRARYNMGISAINLKWYSEAAQHILDALVLQESEAKETADGRKGVTSQALWDGLRTASVKMRRSDLVTLCDQQDLDAYRIFFAPPPPVQELLSS